MLPAAVVLATGDDGRIALVRQPAGPYAGHWMLPGGGIEPGERAIESAAREFCEETGLQARDLRYFATYEGRGQWSAGAFHVLLVVFRATASGDLRPASGEGEARWTEPASLANAHGALLRVLVDAGLLGADPDAALARIGVRMERIDRG